MKKYIALLAMVLAVFNVSAQSIDGDWHLVDKNDIQHFSIKGDTIKVYDDLEFANISAPKKVLRDVVIITAREVSGNKITCSTKSVMGKGQEEIAVLEYVNQGYPVLFMSPKDEGSNFSLKLISLSELQSYANLKDIGLMDEKDFVAFANTVIDLKKSNVPDYMGLKSKVIVSETKYALARLGYNPLIRANEIKTKVIDRYKNNPNTQELAEKMAQ